jgi:hypothetical protein
MLPQREIVGIKNGRTGTIILTHYHQLSARELELTMVMMYNENQRWCSVQVQACSHNKVWHKSGKIRLKRDQQHQYIIPVTKGKKTVIDELKFTSIYPVLMLVLIRAR